MTPNARQDKARRITGYGPIMLRREDPYVIVEIEIAGEWIEVIKESYHSSFSHIIEPLGIESIVLKRFNKLLNNAK